MRALQKDEYFVVSGGSSLKKLLNNPLVKLGLNNLSCMGDDRDTSLICHGVDGKDRGWKLRDDEGALECATWFCCGRTKSEANDSFTFKGIAYQCENGNLK